MRVNFRGSVGVRGYLTAAAALATLGLVVVSIRWGYGFLSYCLIGLVLVALAYKGLHNLAKRHRRAAVLLRTFLTGCIALGLTVLAITEAWIVRAAAEVPAPAEYAIVLGSGVNGDTPSRSLKARLEAALDYAETYPETVLILSGGQGSGEDITEARCMYTWLTQRGVSADRLILEENASNTAQNIQYSRDLPCLVRHEHPPVQKLQGPQKREPAGRYEHLRTGTQYAG